MRKLLLIVFAIFMIASCTKVNLPIVISPDNQTVQLNKSIELFFDYETDGGFASSEVVATNGSVVVNNDGVLESNSGTIILTFTADKIDGAGSVTLKVLDFEGYEVSATVVIDVVEKQTVFEITENISESVVWESGNIYILTTRISILDGVTLTIEPGVIVKGEAGTGSNATALIVARGGKLLAQGTSDSPIIFTSIADEIKPGEVASPNLDTNLNGLWGGLIVLGKAPISADSETVQIEGIPPSDQNGLYGGDNPLDNSGIIKYVSIRHGGANIGEGNEINGLTLGGVGSGTVIENIEIISNQDDGIEWFGGTVNVKNAVVWNAGDDAIDADQNWIGTLDNFVIVTPGDECFELDGPEGYDATSNYLIKNGSVLASLDGESADGLVDNDDNTNVDMMNVYFANVQEGQDFDDVPVDYVCQFSNLEASIPEGTTLTDFFKEGSDAFVTEVELGSQTVGSDLSVFLGWSWTYLSGTLDTLK
jgi:hypothetical protein